MRSKFFHGFALLVGFTAWSSAIQGASIIWASGNSTSGDGNWSDASRWNCPVCATNVYPNNGAAGQSFDVVIDPATPVKVVLDVSPRIDSLQLGAGQTLSATSAQTLAVNGALTSAGNIAFGNLAAMTVGSFLGANTTLNLQSGAQFVDAASFTGNGASAVYLTDPGTMLKIASAFSSGDSSSTASLQLTNGSVFSSGDFQQFGSLSADGIGTQFQTHDFAQDTRSALALSNQAQGSITGMFNLGGGTVGLQSGAALAVNGSLSATTASFSIGLTDRSTALVIGGDFLAGGVGSSVQLTNGSSLAAGGAFSQTGMLRADGAGTGFSAGGDFTHAAASAFSFSNTAVATVGGIFTNRDSTVNLQSGSTLNAGGMFVNSGSSSVSLTDPNSALNAGSVMNGDGTGIASIRLGNGAVLKTPGAFEQRGPLTLDGAGTGFQSGNFTQDSISALRMTNTSTGTVSGSFSNNGGLLNLQSGSVLSVSGSLNQSGNGSIVLTDPNTVLTAGGGLLNGDGSGNSTIRLSNAGKLNAGGMLVQTGSALQLDGIGTAFQSGGFAQDFGSSLQLTNTASGVIDGSFSNAGSVLLQSGGVLVVDGDLWNNSGGVIDVQDGNSALSVAGDVVVDANSKLMSGGQFTVGGTFTNRGEVSLLAPVMIGSDFSQTDTGVLHFVLDGAGDAALLTVDGSVSLSGEVDVTFANGFTPALNDVFQLMQFESLTAGGLRFSLPVWNQLTLEEIAGANSINFMVVPSAAAPEPATSTLVLFALFCGAVGGVHRRALAANGIWWRRGESNPRPKKPEMKRLRA